MNSPLTTPKHFVEVPSMAACYIDASAKVDVMEEQYYFLVDHFKEHATFQAGCGDCRRLVFLESLLLKSFNTMTYPKHVGQRRAQIREGKKQ